MYELIETLRVDAMSDLLDGPLPMNNLSGVKNLLKSDEWCVQGVSTQLIYLTPKGIVAAHALLARRALMT